MYISRLPDKKKGFRYLIRQSYAADHCYRSRDLFDLGDDPSRFIVYPGGNGFYIDTSVQDAIAEQGVSASQDDLEPLFLPFLSPHIRRVIDGFDRKSRSGSPSGACTPAGPVHRFDRYRLHYLKLGRVDHRDMGCIPDRFYAGLHHKSRDEIECDFMAAEQILKSDERAHYTYHIFNLQQCFSEPFAHSHPESLDRERMDRFFVKALCQLSRDDSFWMGSDDEPGLQRHLVRYAVMYFDSGFPSGDPFHDYLQDFMNRHRIHRPPESVQVSLADAARLFGVTTDALNKMDCRELTRQYRRLALKCHPDKGGDQEAFVKLCAAYEKMLRRKEFGNTSRD